MEFSYSSQDPGKQKLQSIIEECLKTFLFLQGNATLHLYPHFKPLAEFPGKALVHY